MSVEKEGRAVVLTAAAYGPILALRLSVKYLRMKRKAAHARVRFYRELREQGLPKNEARYLADEYESAVSIRSVMKLASEGMPLLRR